MLPRPLPTQAIPLECESYPESAGTAFSVHSELSERYPPGYSVNPRDTVQQFGAHVLAREKKGTNPETGEPKLKGKNFGRYCTNDKHSFNARYTIFNANNAEFMGEDSTLKTICAHRHIPDCINEVELNARVPLHELGHNIGGFMDDPFWSGETCQNNPDANNSIMMYNFFYRASFGGWFSCDEIRRLRQAPQQQ